MILQGPTRGSKGTPSKFPQKQWPLGINLFAVVMPCALCLDFGLGPARCDFSISIKIFLELTGCRQVYSWFGQSHEYFYTDVKSGRTTALPSSPLGSLQFARSSEPFPHFVSRIWDFIEGCGGKLEDLPATLGQKFKVALVEPDSKGTVAGISSEKDNVAGVNSECYFSLSIKVFLELTRCRRVYGWFSQSHEYFYTDVKYGRTTALPSSPLGSLQFACSSA